MKILFNSLFQVTVGISISAMSLYFSIIMIESLNFHNMFQILYSINYINIAIGCLLLIFSIIIRSVRWKLFFPKGINGRLLLQGQCVGYFGSNVLPFRLGEVLRTIFISKQSQFSNSFVFGTIVVERTLDLSFLLLLSFITYIYNSKIFLKINSIVSFKSILILLGLCFFVIILLFLFSNKKTDTSSTYIKDFLNGTNSIKPNNYIYIFVLSCLLWIVYLVDVYVILFLFFPDISIVDCLIVLVVCSATFAIPSVPGNIGPYHFGAILSLEIIGYSDLSNKILLSSIILHAHNYILFTLLGAYYYYKSQFGIKLFKSLFKNPQIVYESEKSI